MEITFKEIDWNVLSDFLRRQVVVARHDVDVEVRIIHPFQFNHTNRFEGLYLGEEMVGFACWTPATGHLNNLYITPTARGQGVAQKFVQERPLVSLQVMPHNQSAIAFYERLGFSLAKTRLSNRLCMQRELVH